MSADTECNIVILAVEEPRDIFDVETSMVGVEVVTLGPSGGTFSRYMHNPRYIAPGSAQRERGHL